METNSKTKMIKYGGVQIKSTGDKDKDERIKEFLNNIKMVGSLKQDENGRLTLDIDSNHYDYYNTHTFENPYKQTINSYNRMRSSLSETIESFFPIKWRVGDYEYAIDLSELTAKNSGKSFNDAIKEGTTCSDTINAGFIITRSFINSIEDTSEVIFTTTENIKLMDIPLMNDKGLFVISGKERTVSSIECDGSFALQDIMIDNLTKRESMYVREGGDRILDKIKKCLYNATENIYKEFVTESASGDIITESNTLYKLQSKIKKHITSEMSAFFVNGTECAIANTTNEIARMQEAAKVKTPIYDEHPIVFNSEELGKKEISKIAGNPNYRNDTREYTRTIYNIPSGAEGTKQSDRKYLNMGVKAISEEKKYYQFNVDYQSSDLSKSKIFVSEDWYKTSGYDKQKHFLAIDKENNIFVVSKYEKKLKEYKSVFHLDEEKRPLIEYQKRWGARVHSCNEKGIDTEFDIYHNTDELFYSYLVYPDQLDKNGNFKLDETGTIEATYQGKAVRIAPEKVDYALTSCYQNTTFGLAYYITLHNYTLDTQIGKSANQANKKLPLIDSNLTNEDKTVLYDKIEESFLSYAHLDIKAEANGEVIEIDDNKIAVKEALGVTKIYDLKNDIYNNNGSWDGHKACVAVGDTIKYGDTLAKGACYDNVGLTTALLPYYGMNTDDAIIISKSATKKLRTRHTETFTIDIALNELGDPRGQHYVGTVPEELASLITTEQLEQIKEQGGVAKRGDTLKIGSPLVTVIRPSAKTKKGLSKEDQEKDYIDGSLLFLLKNIGSTEDYKTDISSKVMDVQNKINHEKGLMTYSFTVEYERPLMSGDKIVDMYGNKKLVYIIDDDKMPKLQSTDKIVDMVMAPASLISRKNSASNKNGEIERMISLIRKDLGIDFKRIYNARNTDNSNLNFLYASLTSALGRVDTGETLILPDGTFVADVNVINNVTNVLNIRASDMATKAITYQQKRDGEHQKPANVSGMAAEAGLGGNVRYAMESLRKNKMNADRIKEAMEENIAKERALGIEINKPEEPLDALTKQIKAGRADVQRGLDELIAWDVPATPTPVPNPVRQDLISSEKIAINKRRIANSLKNMGNTGKKL